MLTTKGTARHSRNPKRHFNHEPHENSRKKANAVLSRNCGKDAEHTEEIQIHFTMKGMKLMKLNPGAPVAWPALSISPLATNASPLDHARRAAGGK